MSTPTPSDQSQGANHMFHAARNHAVQITDALIFAQAEAEALRMQRDGLVRANDALRRRLDELEAEGDPLPDVPSPGEDVPDGAVD